MSSAWNLFRRGKPPASSTDIEIKVDFNLDDRPESLRAFVERISVPFADDRQTWHLDLAECGYLGPHAGAIIVSSLLDARSRGLQPRITLPRGSKQLAAFCEFSGLNHHIRGTPFPSRDHPDNVTIPMRSVQHSSFQDPDPIVRLIRSHTALAEQTEEYLRICINEVIQNVEDHARSPVGAVTSARFMRTSLEVRVAIVDRGRGIGTSLRERYPDIADSRDALQRVVEGGYSAKSRPNNMGVGISNLSAIILNSLKGEFFIISEDGFVDGRGGYPKSILMNTRFPGTGVFFIVPVDR